MNTNEAKFILRARRPDGRDDTDPRFAEALGQARLDPALAGWLAREQAFDAAVAARLREVAPPAGLRDAILAGARMQRRTPWWRETSTLAMAAGLAVVIGLAAMWGAGRGRPGAESLALGSMAEWASPDHHPLVLGGRGALHDLLAAPGLRLTAGVPLDFDRLKAEGCRPLRIAGREVLELCFVREGVGELHLYIARRGDFGGDALDAEPVFRERGTLASVAWADESHAYVLVSDGGPAALRAVL